MHETEERALKILNENKFTVLWSGGKDSTAALLWVLNNVKNNDWDIFYIEFTENTDSECTDYVITTAESLGIAEKLRIFKTEDFFALCKKWGIPNIYRRWCLYNLKIKAFRLTYAINVTGMKKSDSKKRASLDVISYGRLSKRTCVNPLVEWSTDDVIEYIKENGVKLNPCYERLGHAGNCCFCPFMNKEQIAKTLNDPYWGPKITNLLKHPSVIEKSIKWRIARPIYKRWLCWSGQKFLEDFVYER
jgi:3'-phosphoadenosine 5'-phosphosulfate sulfotransferase (PAPS reductase)/FAD synthetase